MSSQKEEIVEDQEGNNSFVIVNFEDIFCDELVIKDEKQMDLVF